eukprot:11184000-Lingulodinium_polyedra.AAC.1
MLPGWASHPRLERVPRGHLREAATRGEMATVFPPSRLVSAMPRIKPFWDFPSLRTTQVAFWKATNAGSRAGLKRNGARATSRA